MDHKNSDMKEWHQEIVNRIEKQFPGSIVIHTGTGTPGDDYQDNAEQFEALMIKDEDYKDFVLFAAKLNKEIAEPNGFSISVDSINPELTLEYRPEEYKSEKAKRIASQYISAKREVITYKSILTTAVCRSDLQEMSMFSRKELSEIYAQKKWGDFYYSTVNVRDVHSGIKLKEDKLVEAA